MMQEVREMADEWCARLLSLNVKVASLNRILHATEPVESRGSFEDSGQRCTRLLVQDNPQPLHAGFIEGKLCV